MEILIIYCIIVVLLGIDIIQLILSKKKGKRFLISITLESTLLLVGLFTFSIIMIASNHSSKSGTIYGINKETNRYIADTTDDWSQHVANWILGTIGLPSIQLESTNEIQVEEMTPIIVKAEPHDPGYQLFVEDVSWEQARMKCEKMGGHLATITSENEQQVIQDFLFATELYINDKGVTRIWIGGNDLESGEFTWITGEGDEFTLPRDDVYTNWAVGEPSRIDKSSDILENYVLMFYHKIDQCFYWNDAPVDIRYWYSDRKNIAYLCEWD